MPLVTSEIANHLYAVVNVNDLDNVDESWLRRAAANFEGEGVESRLARRQRNWIADVQIAEEGRDADSSSSMNDTEATWEQRVADLWNALDDHDPETFVAQLDILVAELPRDSAIGLFERARRRTPPGIPISPSRSIRPRCERA